MARKVRIGFAGTGGMGQCAHLKNYAVLPDCEIAAIAELRENTRKKVAERYGIPKAYADAAEMLAKENLDAVVASQPFNRHGLLIPELLKTGKPLFIEKPLAGTIAAGESVLAALQKSGAWIMVGYHKRSDPASEYAKKEIERLKASGELGKLKYVRILMPAGDWIAGGYAELIREKESEPPKLKFDPPAADLNADGFKQYTTFVNYYIHQVNLLRFFLGESYRVTYADPSGVLFAGVSAGGVACAIEMSPYRTTVEWQETVLIAFERGYVKVRLPAPLAANRAGDVEILRDPGEKTPEVVRPHLPWTAAMRNQAANFVAAVRGERKPPCEAAEALEDLQVAREYLRLWKGI